jgi:hypothetical protein
MDQEEAERLAEIIQRECWIIFAHVVAHPTTNRYAIVCGSVVPNTFLYIKMPRQWVQIKWTNVQWRTRPF